MRRSLRLLLPLAAACLAGGPTAGQEPAPVPAPVFDEEGRLLRPEGWERWILVGASIGLSYNDNAPQTGGPGLLHTVYLEPAAYDHYAETGRFPDHTMLALELYTPAEKVSPSKHGYFQGRRVALEIALKDSERFEGGWAYFDFGLDKAAATPFPAERCAACHAEHAETDNVFTQFYPRLRTESRDGSRAAAPEKSP